MRCCAPWEPVGICLDQYSLECIEFHGMSQVIASFTRETIAEREAACHNFPWMQTEKTTPWLNADSLRAWCTKKTMLCLLAVTDENGHPLEDEDESGMRLCTFWCKVFESHIHDERHHSHETILDYVQRAPDDIQWEIY